MGGLNKKLRSNKIKGEDAAKQWANYLNSGLVFIVGYFALEAAFEEYRDVVQGKRPTTPGLGFEVRKKEGHSDKDVMFDAMKEAIQFFNDENKIYVSIEDLCDTGCDIVEMLKTKLQAATALGKMFGYRLFWDLEKGAEPEITGKADSSTCQCKVIFPYSKRATETAKGLLVQYFQMDMQDLANNAKKAIYKERTNILSAMNEF